MGITLPQAMAVIQAGLHRAAERDVPSCFAIVDAGGNLLAFAAHEDAMLACRELAINKAYTSLSLRCPSGALDGAVQPGGPFFGLNTALGARPLVTFAGGRPLGTPVVAAIGVSGGTLEDDDDISAAVVDAYDALQADDGA
ncbi:heme-binding protein [Aeromicrobium sp. Root472D3]|uniref:GlcG/HbpS family heme-binding protein n=1 Tax=Aeromicrobium sp. Root472D3 TaxID=1736540 RepID=UPI0006F57B08|nr:heme-binding protein [Aeromicrobium sp. Root472D3]KQX74197.1 hypothetical protein ASD10_02805 [Aeromicrobium sp. Root472D3]